MHISCDLYFLHPDALTTGALQTLKGLCLLNLARSYAYGT